MGGKGGFDANLLESKSTLESVHYISTNNNKHKVIESRHLKTFKDI